jgi:hypothetical protein
VVICGQREIEKGGHADRLSGGANFVVCRYDVHTSYLTSQGNADWF